MYKKTSHCCMDIRYKHTFVYETMLSCFFLKNICKNFAVSIICYIFASVFHADGSMAI